MSERHHSSKRRSPVLRILWLGVLAYLGMLLTLTGCQKRFIYYPDRADEEALVNQASRMGLEEWSDSQQRLLGWKAPAPDETGTVKRAVVFHGNAGMALDRVYYVNGFQTTGRENSWEVYLFEYPGYGSREGDPGETVFYEAAREALRELISGEDDSIFLVGESLGSGVASQMAGEFPEKVEGLVLVTPFSALTDVASRHFWGFPVRLLLRERYDNVAALKNYSGPVAVVLAEKDEVIPVDLGERLYEGYDGPKQLWIQNGRRHNTLDLGPGSSWWKELEEFLER